MLRASAEVTSTPLDALSITDPSVDPLIPHGKLLLRFVDSVLHNEPEIGPLRDEVTEALGSTGLVDAAGVIGNFEMMNRIADATGMPVGKATLKRTAEWRAHLGLDRFNHRTA